ncbi:leishmanolysin-related zinc metalloendopeptidase [Synechococcus sp. H70.2]|uniref:leishmanolysin-related zinc metalloendopeptidase n=1 Tax=unclassified Synechococcus TaxID=2626047 RepID=UPI0039C00B87
MKLGSRRLLGFLMAVLLLLLLKACGGKGGFSSVGVFPPSPPAVPSPLATPVSQFTLDVRFPDNSLTPSQQAIVRSAALRWQEIIVGDQPDLGPTNIPAGECAAGFPSTALNFPIDDLLVEVRARDLGNQRILGGAAPCFVRASNGLPFYSVVVFNSQNLSALEERGDLPITALHELGHALGFLPSVWNPKGLTLGLVGPEQPTPPGYDPRFLGPRAVEAFTTLGGNAPSVPLENQFGEGSRDSHWRESVLGRELMTSRLDRGGPNPLSILTVGAMADMGYAVNPAAADAFELGRSRPLLEPLELQELELALPLRRFDAAGGEVGDPS